MKAGLLLDVMQELKGLLHDILRKEAKGSCASCGADVNDRMKLEIQLHKTQENFERMERDLKKKEDESKAREDEIRELMSKVGMFSVKVVGSHHKYSSPALRDRGAAEGSRGGERHAEV